MPLPPSTLLANKYRIEAVIGQGAYGRVYRARDVQLDRVVAIKELHKGDGELSSTAYNDYARRFRREAKVQARFNHPHIVHVYELLEPEQDLLYLVMECVEGSTLKDLIGRKGASLPIEDVVRLGQEIVQGLAHVHDDPRDIVHRDIKPSNILLTKDGHAKISDFGLAQVGDESMRSIKGGSHPGTPTYMSLEQGTSSDYLTHKSDLFSAGCVLFEMLTGVLYKHAKRKKQTLKDLRPDVPEWLESVIEQAVNEDLHARPDTAEAMVETLSEGWRAEIEKRRQAIEQAKREEALKQREAQERAAREKVEVEARAKAEQAKHEAERRQREEHERLVREKAEADARAKAEQANREERDRLTREQKAKEPKPSGGSSTLIIALVSLAILAVVIVGVVSLSGIIIANFTQPTRVIAITSTTQPTTQTPIVQTTNSTRQVQVTQTGAISLKGEVTLWHAYSTGSAEETTLGKIVDAVKKKNPDLKINVLQVPFDKIFDNYKTEVASGAGPDIFVAPNDDLGNLARGKLILDVTKQLDGKLGDFAPNAVDGMKVDGKLYGVPESAKAVALYYNKTLIDKAPTTTDELLAAVKGGKSLNLFIGAYHDFGFFGSFGGKLLDDSQKCVLDTTGGADAMQYLLDLKKAGAVLEADYGKFEAPFRQGKVAMMVNGPWALGDYRRDLGDKLGVVPMPAGPKGKAAPFNSIDGFYVNPNIKNADLVLATVLELVSKESSQMYTDSAGHIPIRKDVTSADPFITTFAKVSADGFPRPHSKEFDNYWDPFGNMVIKVLEGKSSPVEGVKEACGLMNKANGK